MKTKINAVIKKVTLCYSHSYFATFKWVSQLIKLSDVWYSNLLYRNYPYFFSFHYTKQHKAIKHKWTKIILVFSTRLICLFRLSYSFHAKCVYERKGMHLLQNACFNYNRKRKKTNTKTTLQNIHRTTKSKKHLCWKGHLYHVVQPLYSSRGPRPWPLGYECIHRWTLHISGQLIPTFHHPHRKYSSFSKLLLLTNLSTIWTSFAFKSKVITFNEY